MESQGEVWGAMPGIQWVLYSANLLLLHPISLSPPCLLGPDVQMSHDVVHGHLEVLFSGALALLSPKISLSQSCHWLTIPQLAVSLSSGWV